MPQFALDAGRIAIRDMARAFANEKSLEDSKASESAVAAAEDKAAADLQKRLADIVGPVAVKGFPPAHELNLALSGHEEEFGELDALASHGKGQNMVVTTRLLLKAWLAQMAKDQDKDRRLPIGVEAAVRQEGFYTFSVNGDAAFAKYADLPVTKPPEATKILQSVREPLRVKARDRVDGRDKAGRARRRDPAGIKSVSSSR